MSILDNFRIDGHVAVVTGSGKGIGRGIAIALAEAGASVAVAARRKDDIDEVVGQIQARGGKAIAVPTDVNEPGAIEHLAQATTDAFGKLTIWVNNHGGNRDGKLVTLDDYEESEMEWMLHFNFVTAWKGAKTAAKLMPPGSSIINITSGAGLNAAPRTGAYGAAKAAMNNMTQTMAVELAPKRIRVNGVAPGPVPTEIFTKTFPLDEAGLAAMGERLAVGRLGTPEDIAACVLWLVSPAGSWVTGQTIAVNGGHVPGSMAVRHDEHK
ncbi:MAG: SDR family NAD(P)-dependent oxidoreductase [Dehalococcoidia bacterium]